MKRFLSFCSILAVCLSIFTIASAQESEWKALNEEVISLYRAQKFNEAIETAKKALDVARETFGEEDLNVATSLNNLAELYRTQEKYEEAKTSFKP